MEGEDHDDRGTFTVDTSVKPHKKVIKSESGLNKGKTIYAIFEHMLTRLPTKAETNRLLQVYQNNPDTARANTVWVLLNTQQFIFAD